MTQTIAIIPARGGSKGIPRKNLVKICGKPLIGWSILQARACERISSVWVTSDDEEILAVASSYGANAINRPIAISGDSASSESAWEHALDHIENMGLSVDMVVAMQATSPLREPNDLDKGIAKIIENRYDSLLSVTEIEDFFMWRLDKNNNPVSVNYDYRDRKPRQCINKSYLENGSFYIFSPKNLKMNKNRLGGKVGLYIMEYHKMFQIDNFEDIKLCEVLMRGYGLDKL